MSTELVKSKFVSRPSSVRPSSVVRSSVSQLSLILMHGFLQILVVASPWTKRSDFFLEYLKKKMYFFTNIFRLCLHRILCERKFQNAVFKLSLNFLHNCFENLKNFIQNATPPTNRRQNFSNLS